MNQPTSQWEKKTQVTATVSIVCDCWQILDEHGLNIPIHFDLFPMQKNDDMGFPWISIARTEEHQPI